MEKAQLLELIKNKIDKNDIFQPILLCWNLLWLDLILWDIFKELFSFYEVDKNNLFVLKNSQDSLKVSEVKDFVSKSNMKSSYKFQIFLIENIQRLTLESSNSLLKFLEEPGKWNIVILTSPSESMILETILSRVVKIDFSSNQNFEISEFYQDMISWFLQKNNTSIYSYFFDDKKLEKSDYVLFLQNLSFYLTKNLFKLELIEEIEKSINFILKNNVIPKYEIDKILLLLK